MTNLFISDNSLEIADRGTSDSILEGVITRVTDAASVVGQGESVSKRRVTITATFTYRDMKLRTKVWEKSFSNWGDYDTGVGGISQQQVGLEEATKKIAEDVLLQTVSGW